MATNQETAAVAIARARGKADSAAAFDYGIAVHGIGGLYEPLSNEVYILANEHLPEIVAGSGEAELSRRAQNALRLWEQLLPELRAFEERCKARKYSGWSNASGGPIRYAEQS